MSSQETFGFRNHISLYRFGVGDQEQAHGTERIVHPNHHLKQAPQHLQIFLSKLQEVINFTNI